MLKLTVAQVEGCDKICCYWFIGLKVEMKDGQAGGQLDLTTPIKAFTDIVMRSAIQINVWKQGLLLSTYNVIICFTLSVLTFHCSGMKIVADYKKRKELKEYLPHQEHWKLKSDRKVGSVAPTSNTVLDQLSPNSAAEGETKVSDNGSEGRKRSPEVEEVEEEAAEQNGDSETQTSAKKRKYENGENEIRSHSETESTENGDGGGVGGGAA